MYLDEAGINNTEDYPYGWCERGQRFEALKPGRRSQRVSMIAALQQSVMIAPMTFEGYCNRHVFEAWLEQRLLPMLKRGTTIILDNASFHKSQSITEIVEASGCQLLYLPPYSPDLNPIEHHWFRIKNCIRKLIPRYEQFRDAVDAAFQ